MADIRYGKEVTGECKICGHIGRTQIHHIISQAQCNKLERPDLLTNQGNLIELCVPCHDMTSSSLFKAWITKREEAGEKLNSKEKKYKSGGLTRGKRKKIEAWNNGEGFRCSKMKTGRNGVVYQCWNTVQVEGGSCGRKHKSQCIGTTKKGKRCSIKTTRKNGYCKQHQKQSFRKVSERATEKPEEEPPGLHDEGFLDEWLVDEILLSREVGVKPREELFEGKSDAWKKRWLN